MCPICPIGDDEELIICDDIDNNIPEGDNDDVDNDDIHATFAFPTTALNLRLPFASTTIATTALSSPFESTTTTTASSLCPPFTSATTATTSIQ